MNKMDNMDNNDKMERTDEYYYGELKKLYPEIQRINKLSAYNSWYELYEDLTSQLFHCQNLENPQRLDVSVKSLCASSKIGGFVDKKLTCLFYKYDSDDNISIQIVGTDATKGFDILKYITSSIQLNIEDIDKLYCYENYISYITRDGQMYLTNVGDSEFISQAVPDYVKFDYTLFQLSFERIARTVKKVALGQHHLLFLTTDMEMYGLGSNMYGQLGLIQNDLKQPFLIETTIDDIACGHNHSIYLTSNFMVFGSGSNRQGQLGRLCDPEQTYFTPIAKDARKIFAGYNNTALISKNNIVYVCGDNTFGQCGFIPSQVQYVRRLTELFSNINFVSIAPDALCLINLDDKLYFIGGRDEKIYINPIEIPAKVRTIAFGSPDKRFFSGYNPETIGQHIRQQMKTALYMDMPEPNFPPTIETQINSLGISQALFDTFPQDLYSAIYFLYLQNSLTESDIDLLLSQGIIDINTEYPFIVYNRQSTTFLNLAILKKQLSKMTYLLRLGANPNLLDSNNLSALDSLLLSPYDKSFTPHALNLLLKYNIDLDINTTIYDSINNLHSPFNFLINTLTQRITV